MRLSAEPTRTPASRPVPSLGIRPLHTLLVVPLLAAVILAVGGCAAENKVASTAQAGTSDREPGAPVRIGVYDSRAVALAYGRSAEFGRTITDLRARHDKAVAAGNKDQAQELNEQGQAQQVRLHLQVFSNAPADDAMERARPHLAEIAARVGVCAIVPAADFQDPSIQTVDVTEDIVKLFEPSEQTLKLVRDVPRQKPMPIEVIARLPADK